MTEEGTFYLAGDQLVWNLKVWLVWDQHVRTSSFAMRRRTESTVCRKGPTSVNKCGTNTYLKLCLEAAHRVHRVQEGVDADTSTLRQIVS